jgi:hypothetical protein
MAYRKPFVAGHFGGEVAFAEQQEGSSWTIAILLPRIWPQRLNSPGWQIMVG